MQTIRTSDTIIKVMGIAPKNKDITYQEFINTYFKSCRLRNLAEVIIKGYMTANEYFLRFTGDKLMCSNVTQEFVDDYKLSLIERLKTETVNSYIFKVSPIVKFGYKQSYIPYNVEFSHMKEQEHYKEIYTTEELTLLLDKTKTNSLPNTVIGL